MSSCLVDPTGGHATLLGNDIRMKSRKSEGDNRSFTTGTVIASSLVGYLLCIGYRSCCYSSL